MPLYFFDIHDGFLVRDEIGRELSDFEAAKAEAMRIASGFATAPATLGKHGGAIIVDVRDKHGDVVVTIRLAYSVETRPTHDGRMP